MARVTESAMGGLPADEPNAPSVADVRAGGGRLPGMTGTEEIAGKRDVDLYVRTYTTLLRSSGVIKLKALVPAHLSIHSSLHAHAALPQPDMAAFMYSVQRLPACIAQVRHVVMGQTARIFAQGGYPHIEEQWQPVTSPGRRRKWWFDGAETLAVMIASVSDLDDLIPTLVAYQIEWNKLHDLLCAAPDVLARVREIAATDHVTMRRSRPRRRAARRC